MMMSYFIHYKAIYLYIYMAIATETVIFTPGTLMTSAAAEVTNHSGCKHRSIQTDFAMQGWRRFNRGARRRHHWFEPTSSLPIFKGSYLVIYKTLALIFPVQLKDCLRNIFMQKSKPKYACLPSKIVEVWIDRFCVCCDWWRRLQPTSSVSPVFYCFSSLLNITHRYLLQWFTSIDRYPSIQSR